MQNWRRKYPVTQKPRSWHYIGPPRMANTMTARARPMPRQIGQAEAKQSQTCVKCQDRSIPITSISKTRSGTSMFPKRSQDSDDVRLGSRTRSRRNCEQCNKNSNHRDKTQPNTDLVVSGSKFQKSREIKNVQV